MKKRTLVGWVHRDYNERWKKHKEIVIYRRVGHFYLLNNWSKGKKVRITIEEIK